MGTFGTVRTDSMPRIRKLACQRGDRCSPARASEDQELVAQEEILRDQTLSSTGFQDYGECAQQMRKEHEEVLHEKAD
jgi:hypothetical protein